MLDILCIGDAKIDINLQIPDNDSHFSLDSEKQNIQISFGRKISIEKYLKTLGGNACNAAIGLARLGQKTGLCAEIGTDEFSDFVLNSLSKENINTSLIVRDKEKPTSFSVCIIYKGERTILSEHVKRDHLFNIESTSAHSIFLTSLGPNWEIAYEKVLALTKAGKKLFFNPGTIQINEKNRTIEELISLSEYIFVNKEEAESLLYGKDVNLDSEKKEIKKLLFGLKSLGAKNVVITDSGNGSFLHDGTEVFHLESLKVKVMDKTGAGDAYSSGFISAILQNKKLNDAMIWGTLNSANVIENMGAQTGLLNTSELDSKLQNQTNLKVEKI